MIEIVMNNNNIPSFCVELRIQPEQHKNNLLLVHIFREIGKPAAHIAVKQRNEL